MRATSLNNIAAGVPPVLKPQACVRRRAVGRALPHRREGLFLFSKRRSSNHHHPATLRGGVAVVVVVTTPRPSPSPPLPLLLLRVVVVEGGRDAQHTHGTTPPCRRRPLTAILHCIFCPSPRAAAVVRRLCVRSLGWSSWWWCGGAILWLQALLNLLLMYPNKYVLQRQVTGSLMSIRALETSQVRRRR